MEFNGSVIQMSCHILPYPHWIPDVQLIRMSSTALAWPGSRSLRVRSSMALPEPHASGPSERVWSRDSPAKGASAGGEEPDRP